MNVLDELKLDTPDAPHVSLFRIFWFLHPKLLKMDLHLKIAGLQIYTVWPDYLSFESRITFIVTLKSEKCRFMLLGSKQNVNLKLVSTIFHYF